MKNKTSLIIVISVVLIFISVFMIVFPDVKTIIAEAKIKYEDRNDDTKGTKVKILDDYFINAKSGNYPLIEYLDITYFPVPNDAKYCNAIGIASKYIENEGFYASAVCYYLYNGSPQYEDDPNFEHDNSLDVVIADYKIKINEKLIDNTTQEYPIINFRGTTYIPMIDRFTSDEFGWKITKNENVYVVESKAKYNTSYEYLAETESYVYFSNDIKFNKKDEILEIMRPGELDELISSDLYNDKTTNMVSIQDDVVVYEDKKLKYNEDDTIDVSSLVNDGDPRAVFNYIWTDGSDTSIICSDFRYVPSTPGEHFRNFKPYIFVKTGDKLELLNIWNTQFEIPYIYQLQPYEYYIASKFVSPKKFINHEPYYLAFIDENKTVHNINKETGFSDIRVIGQYNDLLYVRMCKMVETERVDLNSDGFYTINKDGSYTKIHDYLLGDPFLTSDGKLYLKHPWQMSLINLQTDERVKSQ